VRPSPGSKDAGSDGSERRILYVQFTNPAAYPPLEHSARLFADAGWDVMFLGTGALGADRLEFRPHRRIQVKRMRFVPGGMSLLMAVGRLLDDRIVRSILRTARSVRGISRRPGPFGRP